MELREWLVSDRIMYEYDAYPEDTDADWRRGSCVAVLVVVLVIWWHHRRAWPGPGKTFVHAMPLVQCRHLL